MIRNIVTVFVIGAACLWGVSFYFSPRMWPRESQWITNPEPTDLVESLPLNSARLHIIATKNLGYFFGPVGDTNAAWLTTDNWLPMDTAGVIYAFHSFYGPLRPLYEHMVGVERVRQFGRAFTVTLEPGVDWASLRRFGWAYTASCSGHSKTAIVPALYFVRLGADLRCDSQITHRWHGRWLTAPARLRLYFTGDLTYQVGQEQYHKQGVEQTINVPAGPEDEIVVTLLTDPPDSSALILLTQGMGLGGEQVPAWESVEPLE